jgi:putative nucleotidyltransferase with HDIG domain
MQHDKRLPLWGRIYVSSVVALGGATIVYSAYHLHARPIGWNWFILALLTLLAGAATVKLPSVPATISISETFVFTSVLLFGPEAGTLTVTLDVLAISWWLARRGHPNYRIAFNVFALPASLWVGAHVFYRMVDFEPLALTTQTVQISTLLTPLVAFTLIYFLLNSWLIAVAIFFETNAKPATIWRDNFAWLSLNYFCGASVAGLLVTYTRNLDYTYLAFAVPLLAVLYFTFSMAMGRVQDANAHLKQLNKLYMSTIETLAMAIDAKDQITHGHIRRVQTYAVNLAKTLGVTDAAQISAIEAASLLHDMGKLAVPEYILNKPGPLTPAEFEKMKMHAGVGADILSAIDFPYPVVPIVRHHHENWDGTGYPDGIAGAEIPIGARILSVVDCFDALTSDRPYRPRLTDKEALRILIERRGKMYDPLIVDTFVRVHRQIAPVDIANDKNPTPSMEAAAPTDNDDSTPNQRLDEIAASTDEMLALFELAQGLSPSMTVTAVAEMASKHVRRLIPCSISVLYLFDVDADELVGSHSSGEQAAVGLRIPRGQRLSGWVAANRQAIRNSDPVLDFGDSARAMKPRLRSCLSVPLLARDELVGVLTLYSSSKDGFSSEHERVLEGIARQVSPALKLARESASDKPLAQRDPVASSFDQFLRFSRSVPQSGKAVGALLLICIEDFTSTRGSGGFGSVEVALSRMAEIVKGDLSSSDKLFRSNDGLIVTLPNATEPGAAARADRLAQIVAGLEEPLAGDVGLSIALASAPSDGMTFEALLQAAKLRLTNRPAGSKRNGLDGRVH